MANETFNVFCIYYFNLGEFIQWFFYMLTFVNKSRTIPLCSMLLWRIPSGAMKDNSKTEFVSVLIHMKLMCINHFFISGDTEKLIYFYFSRLFIRIYALMKILKKIKNVRIATFPRIFYVIADRFMAAEEILFRWLFLI